MAGPRHGRAGLGERQWERVLPAARPAAAVRRAGGHWGSGGGPGQLCACADSNLPAPLVVGLLGRFKASAVKECIRAVLKEKLADVQYDPEEIPQLTKSLSEIIKDRLKGEEVCWESRFFSACAVPFGRAGR